MMRIKKIMGIICFVIALAMFSPAVMPGDPFVTTAEAATSIKLNKTRVTLNVGKSTQLSVKGTKKKVTWRSSNKNVATVTSKGRVTAKKAGSATITAKVGNKSAKCKISVQSSAVKNLKKLRNYIVNNGSINSDGNRFIKYPISTSSGTCTPAIVYIAESNSLKFIMGTSTNTSYGTCNSAVTMEVKIGNNKTVSPDFVLYFTSYSMGCGANATINAASYTENTTVNFNVTSAVNVSNSNAQKLANSNLKLAFSGWNVLLLRYTGLELNDIGFTSYN